MSFVVNESGGNLSALNWLRVDGYQLNMAGAVNALSAPRYAPFTPLNAGNAKGLIMTYGSGGTYTFPTQGMTIGNATFTVGTPTSITVSNHGFIVGDCVQFMTAFGSTLPTGITGTYYIDAVNSYGGSTNYFVVNVIDGNTFQVALTPGGSAIGVSDAGSGTISCRKGASVWNSLQKGRTATMTIASPTVVTLTGHGFASAKPTCTFSATSPTTVTCTGHGLVDGDIVGFTSSGSMPGGISNTTVYYVMNATANTFQISSLSRGGNLVTASSTGTGTISLWKNTVQFTTTGTLPSSLTANNVYFVEYIDANTFYIRSTPNGSRINGTGSQSGTHTCWDSRDYCSLETYKIFDTQYSFNSAYLLPMYWKRQAAYDTVANSWRIAASMSSYGANPVLTFTDASSTNSTTGATVQPFFLMWSTTPATFMNGTDAPIFCSKVAVDQDLSFRGSVAVVHYGGTVVQALAGIVCSPAIGNRGYSTTGDGNCMLLCDGSAPRNVSVDGEVLHGTTTGIYFGTEASPISYANRLTISFVTPTFPGSGPLVSAFADIGSIGYYGGGGTLVLNGAYPAKRYATITVDAANGQKNITVDDASGFQANDYVYLTKQDTNYVSSPNWTRYQIQSIAGNVITLTANITGTRKAGGFVVLVDRGYGIKLQGQSNSQYCYGFKVNSFNDLYLNGVYSFNLAPLTVYSSYRFWDDQANKRAGGHYLGNNLIESYQGFSNVVCMVGNLVPTDSNAIIENNIAVGSAKIMSGVYASTFTPYYGKVLKTGIVEARNNIISGCTTTSILTMGVGYAGAYVHDNISHNCAYQVITGGTGARFENNYAYAGLAAILMYNGYYSRLKNNTYERCTNYMLQATAGNIQIGCTEDSPILINTPVAGGGGFGWVPLPDVLCDFTVFSPHGDLSTFDTTYLNAMSNSSKMVLLRNNDTDGNDYWWYSSGGSTGLWNSAVSIPKVTLDVPGTYSTAFDTSNLIFATAGTYDISGGSHIGTLTLTNTSGGNITVYVNASLSYINDEPNITVKTKPSGVLLQGLSGHTVGIYDNVGNEVDYQASVTGDYSYTPGIAATGTWTWVVKKAGYKGAIGYWNPTDGITSIVLPSTPQDFQPSGDAMFQNTTDANCTVSFDGTTQANIVIGNATVLNQAVFDTVENALTTHAGMKWLSGAKSDTSIATLLAGNFLFMTSGWRLKALNNACPNAAVGAFVISTDGTPVDGTNGTVAFLSSSQITAQQVRDALSLTSTTGLGSIDAKLQAIMGEVI